MTLEDELLMLVGARYIVLEKSREIAPEEAEPKWKQHPGVDVTGERSKVRRCKEQYCIGTWDVRSMNQGKLELVK